MDLLDDNINIYLLGGPDDFDDCEGLKINSKHSKVVNLAGELNMIESGALMKYAMMNYVNDSAPMHVASSVNAPTTAIYCSTIPEFGYGPLSDTSRILEVQEKLACRPCGLHGHMACPQKHFCIYFAFYPAPTLCSNADCLLAGLHFLFSPRSQWFLPDQILPIFQLGQWPKSHRL